MEKQVVYVDGHVVGFQFNRKSLGKRIFHLAINKEAGTVYVPVIGREVRVRPIAGSQYHWETY